MPIQVYIDVTENWFESKQILAKSDSLVTAEDAVIPPPPQWWAQWTQVKHKLNFWILKILVKSKIDHIKKHAKTLVC